MTFNHNSASRGFACLVSRKVGRKCCHSAELLCDAIHKKQLILSVQKESKQWQLEDDNFWNNPKLLSHKIHKQLNLSVQKESKE